MKSEKNFLGKMIRKIFLTEKDKKMCRLIISECHINRVIVSLVV